MGIVSSIDNIRSRSLYKSVHDGDALCIGLGKFIDEGCEGTHEMLMIIRKLKRKCMIDYSFRTDGRTPLHMCLVRDAPQKVLNWLLQAKADVNRPDVNGFTPFILAMQLNHGSAVQMMIHRAKIALTTTAGHTAFYWALKNLHESNIRVLVQRKCAVNTHNEFGDTPLHTMVKNTRPHMCQFLLEYGAKIDLLDNFGQSPIMLAVSMQNEKLLEALLPDDITSTEDGKKKRPRSKREEKRAASFRKAVDKALGTIDVFGDTCLLLAIKLEWEYGVCTLLQRKVDPNQAGTKEVSITPLIASLSPPNVLICRLLLKAKALVNGLDKIKYARDLSMENLEQSEESMYVSRVSPWQTEHLCPLDLAIKHQDIQATKLLCDFKADVTDSLMQAAQGDRHEFVQWMQKLNADVNAREKRHGLTPLHVAAGTASDKSILLLLQAKADMTKKDYTGWIPEMHYVRQEHVQSWADLVEEARTMQEFDFEFPDGEPPSASTSEDGFEEATERRKRLGSKVAKVIGTSAPERNDSSGEGGGLEKKRISEIKMRRTTATKEGRPVDWNRPGEATS